MKIGDLVELSSYGKSLKSYRTLHNKIGFVIELLDPYGYFPLYNVYWIDGQQCFFNRTDIKFVRRKE